MNSIGSPLGDSEDMRGDGKWLLRDFGLLEPPTKGLLGTDSNMVAMALNEVKATWETKSSSRNALGIQTLPIIFADLSKPSSAIGVNGS